MRFSVVIPIAPYRDAEILKSLKGLNFSEKNFEIIIEKGTNPSQNRNRGVDKAKEEIIVFLDDDAVVDPNLLKNAEEFLKKHPEIDIVGGPQLTPKDEKGFAKRSSYALTSKFGAWNLSKRYSLKKEVLDADETSITSANLFVKRDVMEKVRFDTKLFPGEDPKFIDDAKKAGFKIAYSPEIIVYHRRRPTIKSLMKQIFNYGKVRPFKEKFVKTLKRPFFLIPSLFLIYLVIILGGIIINPALLQYFFGILKNDFSLASILFIPLLLYLWFNILFSIYESLKNKDLIAIFLLPFIFFILHLSYGVGMIYGYLTKL